MASVPEGHGHISLSRRPENEVCVVMDRLNNMLDTIEYSNEEVVPSQTRMLQEETAQQQKQIIAYRNQINPHFLLGCTLQVQHRKKEDDSKRKLL